MVGAHLTHQSIEVCGASGTPQTIDYRTVISRGLRRQAAELTACDRRLRIRRRLEERGTFAIGLLGLSIKGTDGRTRMMMKPELPLLGESEDAESCAGRRALIYEG